MFEAAAIGMGIYQLDGRILEANPALSRMLGYTPEELAGSHAGKLFPGLHVRLHPEPHHPPRPEIGREDYLVDFSPNERSLGELMRGEHDSFETEKRYRRKDGSEIWGHLTISLGHATASSPKPATARIPC
ncbi:MAG TPA: PAS domain S-box protein [Terriglobales bacterium]